MFVVALAVSGCSLCAVKQTLTISKLNQDTLLYFLLKGKVLMTHNPEAWPSLELDKWQDTYDTLKLWLQVVGKVRLVQTPWTNHSWHVPLYVTVRGLTTSLVAHGRTALQIDFDFIDHQLVIETSLRQRRTLPLKPQSVAGFYAEVMGALNNLGLPVTINEVPNEIPDAVPFSQNTEHAAYDPEYAQRFWQVLL